MNGNEAIMRLVALVNVKRSLYWYVQGNVIHCYGYGKRPKQLPEAFDRFRVEYKSRTK